MSDKSAKIQTIFGVKNINNSEKNYPSITTIVCNHCSESGDLSTTAIDNELILREVGEMQSVSRIKVVR